MRRSEKWKIGGAVLGILGGVGDYLLFRWMEFDMTVGGWDWMPAVCGLFAATYAGLGWAIGSLSSATATIRRQMAALERSQRWALQNEKLAAIGRVAAGLAHEVRNPLGVIRASASMVQESFQPTEEPYRACDFIREEIDRLNSLITALLSFSRPASPQVRPTDVRSVLERALRLAAEELRRRNIDLQLQPAGPIPEVPADPDLLAQVVFGLLVNAAEALGEGGRIQVRSGLGPAGVHVEVADTGPGVPAGNEDHVFEPFFTTKTTGTGLGLPMAARIIQSHGGTIEALPNQGAGPGGAGACFRIQLPLAMPEAA